MQELSLLTFILYLIDSVLNQSTMYDIIFNKLYKLRPGNGNDQNFQRGVFSARGGILVFQLRGGIYPPGKTGSWAFNAIWALIKLN